MTEPLHPIDAVVTWVNGTDPAHRAKLNAYLESIGHVPEAADPTRFNETGEFEFCIASMLHFAPWLRKIFIVTDDQSPEFMTLVRQSPNSDRITIVDHKEIFAGYEHFLPTFNSRSIGTALWRIPGLADRFLYLADDMVLLRPLQPEDFFRGNKMVVRGGWYTQHDYRWTVKLKRFFKKLRDKNAAKPLPRPGMRLGQATSAAVAGINRKYFRLPHNHHPQLRPVIEEFYTQNPALFERNGSVRLRSTEQFSPEALATHLAFRQSQAIIDNRLSTLLLKMGKISVPWLKIRLALAGISKTTAFGCIQSLDLASPEARDIVMKWIEKRIGTLEENLCTEHGAQSTGQKGHKVVTT